MGGTEKSLKDKPLVAVVTVVLNDKENVAKTIESVLSQSYENIEYIVIDGGSTDGTLDILKRYKDRIACLVSEPDRGISSAFNKGLRLSKGELIGILNAADWYESDAVKEIVGAYNNSEKIDVLCGGVQYWNDDTLELRCFSDPNLINRETTIYHPSVFVTKKAYERFGDYDESYRVAMDYELLLRFSMRGARFANIPTVLTNVAFRGLSTNNWFTGLQEVKRARQKYFPAYNVAYYHSLAVYKNLVAMVLKRMGLKGLYRWYWDSKSARTVQKLSQSPK